MGSEGIPIHERAWSHRRCEAVALGAALTAPPPTARSTSGTQLRRRLRDLRADLRYRIGRALARVVGRRRYSDTPLPDNLASVLLCRMNGRMGNALFLTPLIKELHELCTAITPVRLTK